MRNAYTKDILRTIKKNAKRFLAIMVITALGLTAFGGISSACKDMYRAADRFFDGQNLFDIRIASTLGLTDDDIAELLNMPSIEAACGGYEKTVNLDVGDERCSANVNALNQEGINEPYLVSGTLPSRAGEIAVTQHYLNDSGKALGDTVVVDATADDGEGGGGGAENEVADETTDDGENSTLRTDTFTIVAVVVDPMDVSNKSGTAAFRSNSSTDYTFFITYDDVDSAVYTSIYLKIDGLDHTDCYSDEHKTTVRSVIGDIETHIMQRREQARTDAVRNEAAGKIADQEDEMNNGFSEASQQLDAARETIDSGKQKLADGEDQLTQTEQATIQQLAAGKAKAVAGKDELTKGAERIASGKAQIAAYASEIEAGKQQLVQKRQQAEEGFAQAEDAFASKQAELDASRTPLADALDVMKASLGDAWPDAEWNALVAAASNMTTTLIEADPDHTPDPDLVAQAVGSERDAFITALDTIAHQTQSISPDNDISALLAQCAQVGIGFGIIEGGQDVLDSQRLAFEAQKISAMQQIEQAETQIAAGETKLDEQRQVLDENEASLTAGFAAAAVGEAELSAHERDASNGFASARQEMEANKQQLVQGETELVAHEQDFDSNKAEAEQKIADAYSDVNELESAQWYVQDRSSVDSYTSLDSDLSSIAAIGAAFPVLFLIVAVLISLTTMTRMVEEERSLIGTYKALGFSSVVIGRKYVVYALLASVAGSLIGGAIGYFALPTLLLEILKVIYVIPNTTVFFDIPHALFGASLFMVSIVGATALACMSELRETPAALMRPKAPRAGSRILLEHITPLWNRLRFLDKVTARNLFRYKRRLFMTVVGIAGCTALVLAGFAIRDSVNDMREKQYGDIYRYDLMVVANTDGADTLVSRMENDDEVADCLPIQMDTIKVVNAEGNSESMQMVVVPDGLSLDGYIRTPNVAGTDRQLNDDGIFLTQNAADLLGVSESNTIALQTLELDRADATISEVVGNYLGNSVFITQGLYESLFGTFSPNAVYAHCSDSVDDQAEYAKSLLDEDYVMSSVSVAALKSQFAEDFSVLNDVILILGILAAGLAFVVLFTLSNTNITERARELATIKVLGFYDGEVHSYVNKETLVLTIMSIIAGMPLGYLLSKMLLDALKMPSIHFGLYIAPLSYIIAGVLTLIFALVVTVITNRILDKIDMVEALKSVE